MGVPTIKGVGVSVGSFFGKALTEATGYGIGGALTTPLEPLLQELTNRTWALHPSRPLDAGAAAEIVAEDVEQADWGAGQAVQGGISGDNFAALVQAILNAPGLGELLELRRRGLIDDAAFVHGLRKGRLEARWDGALAGLERVLLSPADLANARQQGFVTDGYQLEQSEHQGLTPTDAETLFQLAGLPPGIEGGLQLLRRGIIDEPTFRQLVREGHTKTKYTDALLALKDQLLSPAENVTLAIKTWITLDEAKARNELWGFTPEQTQEMYDAAGRPPGPAQLQTAFNRNLIDRARFDKGIAESDVRTEWTDVEFALRRRYPSLFQLRTLTSSGALSVARVKEILGFEGYEPADAAAMAEAWAGGSVTKEKELAKGEVETLYESRYVDEAQARAMLHALGYSAEVQTLVLELADARRYRRFLDAAVGKLHTLYVSHRLDRETATRELDALNIPSQSRDDILTLWDHEREVNLPDLTPTQLANAARLQLVTPAEALADLIGRGYTDAKARLFLGVHHVTV